MRNLSILLLFLSILFGSFKGFSQVNRKVMGKVADTSGTALADASVLLIHQKDTLKTKINANGEFNFSKIKSDSFSLNISIVGHIEFKQDYSFGKKSC